MMESLVKFFLRRKSWSIILISVFFSNLIGSAYSKALQKFPAVFDLNQVNGSNGFAMKGIKKGDQCGFFVSSAGDVNGDGIADILIGARFGSSNGAGQAYLVFGSNSPWPSEIALSNLNGINGVIINGINHNDNFGVSVASAGDVNGDGIDDLLIGAWLAENHEGQSYVIFGKKGQWPAVLPIASLNGRNGFIIHGIQSGDLSGIAVSGAGDVNNDGIADILIGAFGANNFQGQSYIIFGSQDPWPPYIYLSDINGYNGCIINGIPGDSSGHAVSGAGDINGDGIDDIVIGPYSVDNIGHTYVIFGTKKWPISINNTDLNGNNGFAIYGANPKDASGYSVKGAGDVNGDNIADILIGAPSAHDNIGQSYVLFGSAQVWPAWPAKINLRMLNGYNGFAMDSVNEGGGWSVSGAGDVNGDGISDVIVGAINASYVLFGNQQEWPALIYFGYLDGSNGFTINGVNGSAYAVSNAGDVNGDGIHDILIGIPSIEDQTGRCYVVFGKL